LPRSNLNGIAGWRRALPVGAHLVRITVLVIGALGAFVVPASALAATTIGQATGSGTQICTTDYTWVQAATASSSPSYTVPPGGGVITGWSHTVSSDTPATATMRLKVFRRTGTMTYLTVGHSAVEPLTSPGLKVFATRIGVQAGDLLGLRTGGTEGTDCYRAGQSGDAAEQQGMPGEPDPPVGTTFNSAFPSMFLLNVAAVVEPDADGDGFGDETQDRCRAAPGPNDGCPPNAFSFGKVKKNKGKGIAILTVDVPGPGTLVLTGKGLVKQRPGGASRVVSVAARIVSAAGKVKFKVRSKGKKKRKLNRTGKVKVKAKVTYTPTGGEPNTEAKQIKLVKRL
jgi:hypothetical protein